MLPLLTADGPTHMAADEAILAVAPVTTLRLYAWEPATISVGYFQDYATVTKQLPRQMPVVRRITGGGAIWHADEVTYCLVGEAGRDGMPQRVRDMYPLIHGAILSALAVALSSAHQSAEFALQAHAIGDRRYSDEPRCFASPAADDLITKSGAKVLGSAGRQRGQRILMHGSLKLASNPWDSSTVDGCGLDFSAAAQVIRSACTQALGQSITEDDWSTKELQARKEILDARYANDAWVKRRQGPRP